MDNIFDIRDSEIDTDEIINKIKANIEKRKAGGAYTSEDEALVRESGIAHEEPIRIDGLSDLNDYWDISYNYRISSHRKVIGPVLVKGRGIVNGEVKRYVDPVFLKQKEFNLKVARALPRLEGRLNEKLDAEKADLLSTIKRDFENTNTRLDERMGDIERSLRSELSDDLERNLNERLLAIADDIQKKAWLASVLEGRARASGATRIPSKADSLSSIDYASFSEEISKAWTSIGGASREAPSAFGDAAARFEGMGSILDIGCGNGYFLGLLKAKGISAYGIDVSEDYVKYCLERGLDVKKADAISHLRSIGDDTLGGIFISQVVEHLPIEDVDEVVKLCHEKLKPGASLVITTPNILSVLVASNLFYMDPTHISHVHPDVLRFILKSRGFKEVEDRFYQEVPEDHKLRRIPVDGMPPEQRMNAELLNGNFDALNRILFGYRDYAAFARKG